MRYASARAGSRRSPTHGFCPSMAKAKRTTCSGSRLGSLPAARWRRSGLLDRERAARLGAQVARQLVAMEEAAIAPDSVTADDLVVEGVGDQERAWLLPNPHRSTGEDVSIATQSLVAPPRGAGWAEHARRSIVRARGACRTTRSAHPGAPEQASFPSCGYSGGRPSRRARRHPRRRRHSMTRLRPVRTPRPPGSLLASRSARLRPSLPRARDAVWAATPSGALIKVDVNSESVVGAPLKMFSDKAYVTLAVDEDTLWAGGPGLLVRLDSSTGRRAL